MKKTWEDAKIEELVIEATAHGGREKAEHDGTWWEATHRIGSNK